MSIPIVFSSTPFRFKGKFGVCAKKWNSVSSSEWTAGTASSTRADSELEEIENTEHSPRKKRLWKLRRKTENFECVNLSFLPKLTLISDCFASSPGCDLARCCALSSLIWSDGHRFTDIFNARILSIFCRFTVCVKTLLEIASSRTIEFVVGGC